MKYLKLLALPVFIMATHFAFAQDVGSGNRVATNEVINLHIPNDSAIIEGEIHANVADKPAMMGKIKIKETGKEVTTDDKGYFKTTVAKGNYKIMLYGFDKSSKYVKDVFIMDVKVVAKSQHRLKLTFYVDVSRHK